MEIYKTLPSDIIYHIIEYTGKIKWRNGKYINCILNIENYAYIMDSYIKSMNTHFIPGSKYLIRLFSQIGFHENHCIGQYIGRQGDRLYFTKFRLQINDESYNVTTYFTPLNKLLCYKIK
jgi:hypothetical protein